MSFDPAALRGDLFHLCGTILEPGAVILPGNFGRVVRTFGWAHGHAMREHTLEEARKALAPHLPSRLACAFVCPTLDEARAFRGSVVPGRAPSGFEAHLIYRVRLREPESPWFLGCSDLIVPPTRPGYLHPDWPRLYWLPLDVGRQDGVGVREDAGIGTDEGGDAVTDPGIEEGRVLANLPVGRRELLTLSALVVVERLDGA